MFFFRRRGKKKKKKKKDEEETHKEKVNVAHKDAKSSESKTNVQRNTLVFVGNSLGVGKNAKIVSVSFPHRKLGIRFIRGEVVTTTDIAEALGVRDGDFFWRVDNIDVVHATTTELAPLSVDERILHIVKHKKSRPIIIDFLRREVPEQHRAKIERRNSNRELVKHRGRRESISDSPSGKRISLSCDSDRDLGEIVTKKSQIAAASAGLRMSTRVRSVRVSKTKSSLIISGPDGAVRHIAQMPRRKGNRKESTAVPLPGLAKNTESPHSLVYVFMRHDKFEQSESQVALTFKHELRVSRTMTVRQLLKNLQTVGDGNSAMEVLQTCFLNRVPKKISTRNWDEIASSGTSIDVALSSSKRLVDIGPKMKVVMIDVMSRWDGDFATNATVAISSLQLKDCADVANLTWDNDDSEFGGSDDVEWGGFSDDDDVSAPSKSGSDPSPPAAPAMGV